MLFDRYENQLATASQSARDNYIAGVDCILSANFGAEAAFAAAVVDDPGFALGHAGLARARMLAADGAGAKTAIARAKAALKDGQDREAAHVQVFELLIAGQTPKAYGEIRAHLATYPRDALIAQTSTSVFGLIGFSGQTGREAELLAFTAGLLPHYGEDWWMLSQHAISLCETGQSAKAEALMERALLLNPRNANAAHFKSHSLYEQGETIAGVGFLSNWLDGYDPKSLIHGHLNWHVALWSLETGDVAGMWARVDGAVQPGASLNLPINILTDTASILNRADLAGVAVPKERWADVSAYATRFFPKTGLAFIDIHAALAHAMAGETDELERIIATATGPAGDLVTQVSAAWKAVAASDWSAALTHLTAGMANHERLGGSRAQRDLLEFALLGVLLRLGRADEADRMLTLRRPALTGMHPVAGLH